MNFKNIWGQSPSLNVEEINMAFLILIDLSSLFTSFHDFNLTRFFNDISWSNVSLQMPDGTFHILPLNQTRLLMETRLFFF